MRFSSLISRARQLGALGGAGVLLLSGGSGPAAGLATQVATFHPMFSDQAFVSSGVIPPTEAQCYALNASSGGRRCFAPAAMQNSYNLPPLYAQGLTGKGVTIAIVDSFGSLNIASDLNVFNNAFGLQHMCGEANYTCAPGDPTFSQLAVQGSPSPVTTANGHQENRAGWDLEVSLDVEWAHAIAPQANILLVTTPTAETLGVQGFPDMMKAEQFVVDNGLASVISQSFAAAEESFGSTQSLENLRHAFKAAQANRVTVFGSSGDSGTANVMKQPVGGPNAAPTIPYPTVVWPASDPLVTGVGGTYLCTNPNTGLAVDNVSPPTACRRAANAGQREVGWIGSGGGFSHVFGRPDFQNSLPAGSSFTGIMRGVPDIALQASSRTGVLIYDTSPGGGTNIHDPGWFVIGGTSASSPQWAGITAIANQLSQQLHGTNVGYLNPALYAIAGDPVAYARDFFDVVKGQNQTDPTIPGYASSKGWDPVTGLGTPNAANLVPDLVAATNH